MRSICPVLTILNEVFRETSSAWLVAEDGACQLRGQVDIKMITSRRSTGDPSKECRVCMIVAAGILEVAAFLLERFVIASRFLVLTNWG